MPVRSGRIRASIHTNILPTTPSKEAQLKYVKYAQFNIARSSRISSYFCNIARNKFLSVSIICSILCKSVTQIPMFSQSDFRFKFTADPNVARRTIYHCARNRVAASSKKCCAQCCLVKPKTFSLLYCPFLVRLQPRSQVLLGTTIAPWGRGLWAFVAPIRITNKHRRL